MPGHLCPVLAASGELRVTLHGAAGQRTVWSVAGHRSRGWQGAVVPVQSPGEFQVSGATLGCRVTAGVHQPPRLHLPPQISFEITTRRWPMEGTVALDDITYSASVGCHSSPGSPAEGARGSVLAVKGQLRSARGAGLRLEAALWAVGRV